MTKLEAWSFNELKKKLGSSPKLVQTRSDQARLRQQCVAPEVRMCLIAPASDRPSEYSAYLSILGTELPAKLTILCPKYPCEPCVPSNSSLHQWLQFLVQFVKRVMVDLKKKNTSHVSTSLSTNPNSYQTNELQKLVVGERGGNVLLQLLPQLVSPENNQR